MGLLCGCWIFGDASGASALARLPISQDSDADSRSSIVAADGPCLLVRDFQSTSLPEPSSSSPVSREGLFAVWDGRLDNRQDLGRQLGGAWTSENEDIDLVAAAFVKWHTGAFERMRGDWAVTIWNAEEKTLVLAKDPMGTRPLFYSVTPHGILWSNSLDWLVRRAGTSLEPNFEYVAGWLSFFAAAHVTPYAKIDAVPPSSFVQLRMDRVTIRKYWEFQPRDSIRCPSDFEYEEQFRCVFACSIRRRLRSNTPLLAELSGGMDSSSIVCVADAILAHEHALAPRLDTLSYYDDNEPNWNERPFFSLVEAKRGRSGLHVRLDPMHDLDALFGPQEFAVTPAKLGRTRKQNPLQSLDVQGYGAILSGIGGDEFTGGVPTPIPELADLLVAGRLRSVAQRLKSWSLHQRRPWMHVLFDTLRSFAPFRSSCIPARRPPSWLNPQFRIRYQSVLNGYEKPLRVWGPRPSFQENISAVEALRRQLAVSTVQSPGELEKRYPYLDTDLLEFLFGVPREQLVQPGRRRSLMRRALAGIVPHEILERKRKAYVTRAPRMALAARWEDVQGLTRHMLAESLGIVSSRGFREALEAVRGGKDTAILPLQRMLVLECWLRNLAVEGMFSLKTPAAAPGRKRPPRSDQEHGGNTSFG